MPQYRVLQKSFINNHIVEEGDVVDYDGEPSDNLELIKRGNKKTPPAAESVGDDAAGDALV